MWFFLIISYSLSIIGGPDHAPIYKNNSHHTAWQKLIKKIGFDPEDYQYHIDVAEYFKDKYFRDDDTKNISLNKVKIFLDNLHNQYYKMKNRVYETKFLEQLDVAKHSAKTAQRQAIKPQVGRNILSTYELYLIPLVEAMILSLENAADNNYVEGLVDDFIRGYIPYLNPNAFNSRYTDKVNLFGGLYYAVDHFERDIDSDHVQANNLQIKNIVEENAINQLLTGNKIKIGDYLTEQQIQTLLKNDYDISKIDPGKSAFWQEISAKEKLSYKDPKYFPTDTTQIIFDRVLYGGSNSPKVRIKFSNKYNKMTAAKLKIGAEVPSELASAALLKLLGFNVDSMAYYPKIVIHLKEKSFENFEAEMRQKFGQVSNIRYNFERGVDINGERFITWQDVLIESRPDEEIRVGPLDSASWDLANRREYRGSMLAFAWLALNDLKSDNKKVLLVKKHDEWTIEHRIHDTGICLGPSFVVTGLESVLNLPAIYTKANEYKTNFLTKTSKGIKIAWNDFAFQYRMYGTSTYYDLKWMARKIALLSKNDIAKAFMISGMPADVAHLFIVKTIMRRNNIVKSFDLENEYGLLDEPEDIKVYSPEAYPNIKNGKISKKTYEGKNIIPTRIRTWGSFFSTIISGQNVPYIQFINNVIDSTNKINTGIQGKPINNNFHWYQPIQNFGPFDKVYLLPGITFIPARYVIENPQNLNTILLKKHKPIMNEDGSLIRTHLPYMVIDEIKVVVGMGIGVGRNTILPLQGKFFANVLIKTLTHRHFAETIKDAWLSPYLIPKIMSEGKKKFAAFHLNDLETIESYYSLGLNISSQITLNWLQYTGQSALSIGGAINTIGNKLIYRDQFGRLHYVREEVKRKEIHALLNIFYANQSVLSYAALAAEVGKINIKGNISDYIIGHNDPLALQTHNHDIITKEHREKEYAAFLAFKEDPEHANVMLNFSRSAEGSNSTKSLNLFFFLANNEHKSTGQVIDTLSSGETRELFQTSIYSGKHIGDQDIGNIQVQNTYELTDIAVLNGKSKKTILEVEKRAPDKFTMLVSSRVFLRKADRKGMLDLIKNLNVRYGHTPCSDNQHQFFADLNIPDEDEHNLFRKIYADMRILIDGEYLLKKINALDEEDVLAMLDDFFTYDAITIKKARYHIDNDGVWHEKLSSHSYKDGITNKLEYSHKYQRIMHNFRKLKKVLKENNDWSDIWVNARNLVHNLFSKYYGVHILRAFLNIKEEDLLDRAILVYGEIRNLGDDIATLERPQGHLANLRCTGAHWGNYDFGKDKKRLIQYHLKFEDPTYQLPIYWSYNLNSFPLLGRLEVGQPPNWTGEGI